MHLRFSIQSSLCILLSMFSVCSWSADRWVIHFKENARTTQQSVSRNSPDISSFDSRMAQLHSRIADLSRIHKRPLVLVRPFGERGAVVTTPNGEDLEQARLRLLSDPSVESVELDRRIHLRAQSPLVGVINSLDVSRRSRSWFHQDLSIQPASINTGAMWVNFHGTAPTIVAVLDTGVLPGHPMLQGHLLPGYDFVADPVIGADGQNTGGSDRDPDPTDPGDGVTPTDLLADASCAGLSNSSWHGTFVSGLLAGNPVPTEGIFSVNWNAAVLPVRVLGKCGGFSSDLADGIRWAAGLSVPGVPNNPFPAKVINLSLGAQGTCVSSIEGAAILAARQAGSLVVVATGNDGGAVDSPANCPGALGVGAIDQEGLKAGYSNFGSTVQLSAPGGDAAFPIWSAGNTGLAGPLTNTYTTKVGTSFSAPMVAGAASLYWSLNPSASVDSVENLLKTTSRPFLSLPGRPTCTGNTLSIACNCTRALCGAGMLDIANLINTQSSAGFTNLFSNTGNVIPPGQTRLFSSSGTINSSGQVLTAVSFDVINVLKSSSDVLDPVLSVSGLNVDVSAPDGVIGFDLRAQAANGRTAIASIVVANQGATSPTLLASLLSPLINGISGAVGVPPSALQNPVANDSASVVSSTSSGGGGGILSLFGLLACVLLLYCFIKVDPA